MSRLSTVRDAAVAIILSATVAITFNALRPRGIDFIVFRAYDVFVPCPEPVGEAEPIQASRIRWRQQDELVLDARSRSAHEQWHPPGVLNVPFDFLLPVTDDVLGDIARSRSVRVVVIGDGLVPDTGEQLARELNGLGIKNVHYIRGGMNAVKESLGKSHDGTPRT